MKFLIFGGYSCSNPGDEAILKSTVYRMNEMFPGSFFYIWAGSQDFELRFDRPVDYEVFHMPVFAAFKKNTFISKLLAKLYVDFYPFSRAAVRRMGQWGPLLEVLQDADKVVFSGGGYINSDFCLLEMNFIASLAREAEKPYYLLGQTIGPFRKESHREMAAEMLGHAEKVAVRDAASNSEMPELRHKIRYGVDDALSFDPRLTAEDKAAVDAYFPNDGKTRVIGVSLRNWAGSRKHYARLAQGLETFCRIFWPHQVKILFIPMETSRHCDDRIETREFTKHFKLKTAWESADQKLTAEQKFYLIGRLDFLIGMRFHALVFAFANGVPAAGLYNDGYYFRKMAGLFGPFLAEKNLFSFKQINKVRLCLQEALMHGRAREVAMEAKEKIVRYQKDILKGVIGERPSKTKVSVIIPTMNRAADLKSALHSVIRQSRPPHEVIVVDQSENGATLKVFEEAASLPPAAPIRFRYLYQEEKSLVKARNRGLDAAEGDIISFFDDDVVLYEDYFERVVRHFDRNPSVGALSGNTLNLPKLSGVRWALRKAAMRLFALSDFKGNLTASGFGYPVYEREITKVMDVELLPGCNMNYRREAAEGERFDEWFTGYSFREDVDYSYRISRKTRMRMIPDAKLHHNYSRANRLDAGTLKKMEIPNYYYLFKKFRKPGRAAKILFIYSLFGLMLIDFIEVLNGLKKGKFSKFSAAVSSALSLKHKHPHPLWPKQRAA